MTAQQVSKTGAVFLAGLLMGLSFIIAFASKPAHADPIAQQIICLEFGINNAVIGNIVTLNGGFCPSNTSTTTAALTVIKVVNNAGGGTAQASDFTMHVSGVNASTSTFPGSAAGTIISLDPGSYGVSESGGPANYTASFSGDCDSSGNGNILASTTKTCTITNTYTPPPPPPPPSPSCTIISDANTTDVTDGHAAVLVSPLNAAWTATSTATYDPSAAWVWSENPAINTTVNTTKVFTRTFDIVGAPLGGSVDIAADNGYVLKINGTVVEDASTTEKNYVSSHHFDVSSELVTGTNTIEVDVTNFGVAGSDGSNNPAGVIFQVNLPGNNCGTVVPPPTNGVLEVKKVIVGGPGVNPDNFSFQVKEGSGVFGTALPFDPSGTSNMGVAPDAYTVVEVASSTYTTTYANSANANADCNNLAVTASATTTCTVTNTYITPGGGGGGGGGPTPVNVVQTVVVHQADLTANPLSDTNKWFFYNDQTNTLDNALGSFVDGPATAPLGAGSAQISATTTQGIILGTLGYIGTKLSDVASLSYSTYRSAGDPALALALQFDINPDITVATTSYDGRLVYEPYYTHTVADNTWQTWHAQDNATSAGHGNWWFSKGWIAAETGCSQAAPCTWSQVLTKLPNIGVSGTTLFKAGSNWSSSFTGNVDDFVLGTTDGTNSTTTTFDFEPTASNPGGGGGGGGGGGNNTPNTPGGGGSGGGGVLGGPLSVGFSNGGVVLGTSTEATDCSMYLTGYIRLGGNNDAGQVVKLQTFLDEFEGANLSITGVYDDASYNAVKAFQLKYAADVLTPWGEVAPTGYVYYTTRKEVNTVYCNFTKQFPLTAQQLQEIEQFKAGVVGGAGTGNGHSGGSNAPQNQGNPDVGLTNGAASLTASVEAGASSTGSAAPQGGGSWWESLWHWLRNF